MRDIDRYGKPYIWNPITLEDFEEDEREWNELGARCPFHDFLTCGYSWKFCKNNCHIRKKFEHSKNHQSSNPTPVKSTVKVQNRPSKFKHLNQNLNFTAIVER